MPQKPQHGKPDAATPEWCHALTDLCRSPFWNRASARGLERWGLFVEAAMRYPTYDDLPDELKTIYQQAYRQLSTRSDRSKTPS